MTAQPPRREPPHAVGSAGRHQLLERHRRVAERPHQAGVDTHDQRAVREVDDKLRVADHADVGARVADDAVGERAVEREPDPAPPPPALTRIDEHAGVAAQEPQALLEAGDEPVVDARARRRARRGAVERVDRPGGAVRAQIDVAAERNQHRAADLPAHVHVAQRPIPAVVSQIAPGVEQLVAGLSVGAGEQLVGAALVQHTLLEHEHRPVRGPQAQLGERVAAARGVRAQLDQRAAPERAAVEEARAE